MNQSMILGIVRHLLTSFGGILTAKGYADSGTIETVAGAIITIAGFVWSIATKKTPEPSTK